MRVIALFASIDIFASVDMFTTVDIDNVSFRCGKSGVRAVFEVSDHRRHMPGSSSNRQRGCSLALLGYHRSREIPKLFLLEAREWRFLLFSFILYHNI